MTQVILPDVRLSFPDLWTPGDPPAGSKSEPKFGAQLIMTPGSAADKLAKAEFMRVAQEKFGANYIQIIQAMNKDKKCLRNGNENLAKDGSIRDGYAGMFYVVARNKARPAVVANRFHNGKPIFFKADKDGQVGTYVDGVYTDIPFEVTPPYGGCYVNAKVEFYAMDKPGLGKLVACTLYAVQYLREGAAFGAAPGNADGFEDVAGADADFGGDAGTSTADDLFGG